MDDIRTLLRESLAYHYRARDARRAHQSDEALAHLTHARDLRVQANTADPAQADLAWEDERAQFYHLDINAKLLLFYADHLV